MISVCALKQTVNINASGDPAELPGGALKLPPYPQQICWGAINDGRGGSVQVSRCPVRVTVSISVTLRCVTSWHTLLSSTSHSLHPGARDCEHKTWNVIVFSRPRQLQIWEPQTHWFKYRCHPPSSTTNYFPTVITTLFFYLPFAPQRRRNINDCPGAEFRYYRTPHNIGIDLGSPSNLNVDNCWSQGGLGQWHYYIIIIPVDMTWHVTHASAIWYDAARICAIVWHSTISAVICNIFSFFC